MNKYYFKLLKIFVSLLITSSITLNGWSQVKFKIVYGNKANYQIEIPTTFKSDENKIGPNVDLKFGDLMGISLVTVVKKLPNGVRDEQLKEMAEITDEQFVYLTEADGFENVKLISRHFKSINAITSYVIQYTAWSIDETIYFYNVNQFYKGKMFAMTFTCSYSKKYNLLPYINRIVNSLKYY